MCPYPTDDLGLTLGGSLTWHYWHVLSMKKMSYFWFSSIFYVRRTFQFGAMSIKPQNTSPF